MDTRDKITATRELQGYLRELYQNGLISISVIPDGVYDDRTRAAVVEFQLNSSLPATGIVDYATWTALEASASKLRRDNSKSEPLFPFERIIEGGVLSPEDAFDLVFIVQLILKELAAYGFGELAISGIYDPPTRRAIEQFQLINGIQPSGLVDKKTWNALARAYNKYISKEN